MAQARSVLWCAMIWGFAAGAQVQAPSCCLYHPPPLVTGAKSMPPRQMVGLSEKVPEDQHPLFKAPDGTGISKGGYQLLVIPNDGHPLELQWTGQTSASDGAIEIAVWDPAGGSYASYLLQAVRDVPVSHVLEIHRPAAEPFAFVLVGSPSAGAQISTDLLAFQSLRSSPEAGRASAPAAPDFRVQIDKTWAGERRMLALRAGTLETCTRQLPHLACRPDPSFKIQAGDVVVIRARQPLSGTPAGYEEARRLCQNGVPCRDVVGLVVQTSLLEAETGKTGAAVAAWASPCAADPLLPAETNEHPSNAIPNAIRLLRQGDPVRAVAHLESALRQRPQDPDLAVFLGALLHDADPGRASALQSGAKLDLPPFSQILILEDPTKAGRPAYVSVANALVRASADPVAAVVARLPIASRVQVRKRVGDFWQISFSLPRVKARSGYVFDGLLAPARPTVKVLSQRVEADGEASGPDWEAMIWWRALNLEPRNPLAYDRLLTAAGKARRYGMMVDALELATRSGRWPAAETPSATANDLRLFFFRAAQQRAVAAVKARLGQLSRSVPVTGHDRVQVALSDYYDAALRKPDGLWRSLQVLSLRPPEQEAGRQILRGDDGEVVLAGDCSAWRVDEFNLPGGALPVP